jgi:hypothetical protein
MKLRTAFTAIVLLVLIGGVLTSVATSEVQAIGTAAGIRYVIAHSGFQGYSFSTSPTGFRYVQRSWFGLGRPSLEVSVDNGRVLINQTDRGPIKAGERLEVTTDSRVLVNGKELPGRTN